MCSYLFLILPPLFHSFFIICPKKQKKTNGISKYFFFVNWKAIYFIRINKIVAGYGQFHRIRRANNYRVCLKGINDLWPSTPTCRSVFCAEWRFERASMINKLHFYEQWRSTLPQISHYFSNNRNTQMNQKHSKSNKDTYQLSRRGNLSDLGGIFGMIAAVRLLSNKQVPH